MPQSDEPGRASRPSLLSEQQPAAGDDQSILSKLDGRTGAPKAAHAPPGPGGKRRMGGVAAGIAAAVVLGGGVLAWSMGDNDDSAGAPAALAAAAPAPAAAASAAPLSASSSDIAAEGASGASGDTAAAGPAPAPESDVSAATILDEVPGAATAATAAALAAGTAAVAARPPAPAPHDGKDELAALLDKPDGPSAKAKPDGGNKADAKKKAALAKAERKAKAEKDRKTAIAAAKTKKKTATKQAPQPDSDEALLAALLAHSKASPAPRDSKGATGSKRCAGLASAAETDKCRARLCEGEAKAKPECKTSRVAEIAG